MNRSFSRVARFLLFFLSLSAGGIFLYLLVVDGETESPSVKETSERGEDVLIQGVNYFEFQGDGLQWSATATEARFFQSQGVIDFYAIEAISYRSVAGKMILCADKGRYETDSRVMSVEGNVRGSSDDGYRFWTSRLAYDASTKVIDTEDKVRLEKDRITIEGVGLRGSLETQSVRMLSSIKATYSSR